MNRIIQLFLVSTITVYAQEPPGGYYQSKYDSLDVENVLNNKRLVNYYANCLLNRGPCPPQGADLKRILPEALETSCLRCTEKQKQVAVKTIIRLRTEYPVVWSELVSAYDPDGDHFIRLVKTIDPTIEIEDQSNLLSNRFGDEDFPNNLETTTNKPTKKPTKRITKGTTRRPTSYSTSRPTTRTTVTTSPRSTEPSMTRTEEPFLDIFTTLPNLVVTNRSMTNISTSTPTTVTNTTTTTAGSTTTEGQQVLTFGWRPTVFGGRPQVSRPPHPLIQSNANLLSSIGEIGNRVIQAGTQVAGMVLSSVQALFQSKRTI